MAEVYVGLGSNLGDREDNLRRAVQLVGDLVAVDRVSSIWLTEPVGVREQPAFYNAVLAGRSSLSARMLLDGRAHPLTAASRMPHLYTLAECRYVAVP